MNPPKHLAEPLDEETRRDLARKSRRGFALWIGGLVTGVAGIRWLATQSNEAGIPWPLRRVLEFNEQVATKLIGTQGRATEFPMNAAGEPRVNGRFGLKEQPIDQETWRLRVQNDAGRSAEFRLADIQNLPRHEHVTELKCIEGWSQIVHWSGCRLSDFLDHTGLARQGAGQDLFPYVGLTTSDGAYYVGLDMPSAMHPQTLLAYEMNGKPLTPGHGAPLRLVIPVKYGIKNIKGIATISLSQQRPADYWAERGYDWFAGL
ncbi:molybdopterin-dependent oxidoreductase [bacterium]|nr:molybdopterin-dependent oxidoreductase [bacterium]